MRLASAAGGFLLTVPHVAGFTTSPAASSQLETSTALWRQPNTVVQHCGHAALSRSPWLSSGWREGPECPRGSRRRFRWATFSGCSSGRIGGRGSLNMFGTPEAWGRDHERSDRDGGLGLRLVVVGENADQLGVRLAERYGLVAASMDDLMKGRKGRKTDKVRAKAVTEWIGATTDAARASYKRPRGWVLTGFPTTAGQAESLDEQGVEIERMLIVAGENEQQPLLPKAEEGTGDRSSNAATAADAGMTLEEEKHQLSLAARMGRRLLRVPAQPDVDTLCDAAARILAVFSEEGPTKRRSSGTAAADDSDDGAPPPRVPPAAAAGESAAKATVSFPLPPQQPSSAFRDADMMMSPAEQAAAHAVAAEARKPEDHRDPERAEAAERRAQSRAGAEAKRAEKERLRRKKRAANEAQRLDTPFYLAVAQGGPKARFRPPVPMIPSRITERLSSAVTPGSAAGGAGAVAPAAPTNTRLEFGPLVLDSPASDCLLAAGITEPTGIQSAGMGPILDGESVILHAMTGSGKTLTFLLPLMQRYTPGLCSAPAANAAAEEAADNAANMAGGGDGKGDRGGGGLNGESRGFREVGVGEGADAPWQVLLALPTRELAVQVAREVVLLAGGLTASVELLVDASVFRDLSKVTAPIVVGSAKVLERLIRKSRPAVRDDVLPRIKCIVVDEVDRLVDVLSKHAPAREAEKRKRHARPIAALLERVLSANGQAQVVACSATIGRPLRRELGHIIRRASAIGASSSTPYAVGSNGGSGYESRAAAATAAAGGRELRLIRDATSESSERDFATERAVIIPSSIRHLCVPLEDGDFFSRLEALAAAVRKLRPRRPLIFVPPQERVTAVVAHLRRAGGDVGARAVALHEAMGFVSDEDFGGVRGRHGSEAIQRHDRLIAGQSATVAGGGSESDLLAGWGGAGRPQENGDRAMGKGVGDVLVTGEDSARGLHFDDVDFVFLMQKPKSPDEYVHLAGRTGRQGKAGTVVSLVDFEEFRKLRGWSRSLKVNFEPQDILNVVKR